LTPNTHFAIIYTRRKGDAMTVTVAKMNGKIVQVVSVRDRVAFSPARGWVCVTPDVDKADRAKHDFRWVPASTRFEWVRTFNFKEPA